jgi:predicted nuclease of predicted toxin-antitoxin system
MRVKLDENVSRSLKQLLVAQGHDVCTATDEGLLAQPDPVIAAAAARESRILLTLDVEFADVRKYPPGKHPGIILFRPHAYGVGAVNRFIEAFIRENDVAALEKCVVVVDPGRVRVRWPSLDDAESEGTV